MAVGRGTGARGSVVLGDGTVTSGDDAGLGDEYLLKVTRSMGVPCMALVAAIAVKRFPGVGKVAGLGLILEHTRGQVVLAGGDGIAGRATGCIQLGGEPVAGGATSRE